MSMDPSMRYLGLEMALHGDLLEGVFGVGKVMRPPAYTLIDCQKISIIVGHFV